MIIIPMAWCTRYRVWSSLIDAQLQSSLRQQQLIHQWKPSLVLPQTATYFRQQPRFMIANSRFIPKQNTSLFEHHVHRSPPAASFASTLFCNHHINLHKPNPLNSLHNFSISSLPTLSMCYQWVPVSWYHSSTLIAAGHNKWSKIKHKKAVADKEKSKMAGKFADLIMKAVRTGGSTDPDANLRLAGIILQARQAGLPKVNIENAIRSAGAKRSDQAYMFVFDAQGPSGYHLLVEVLTDNLKRTRPQIRNVLTKHGGLLGEPGSSTFMFEHKGIVRVPKTELDKGIDPLELAIEVGAEDIILDEEDITERSLNSENLNDQEVNKSSEKDVELPDDCFELKCEPKDMKIVTTALQTKGLTVSSASLAYLPKSSVSLTKEAYENAMHLMEVLMDHDDVVEVYANFVNASNEVL